MYYKASSVIAILTSHPELSLDNTNPMLPFPEPSCPKQNDPHDHCKNDFPKCEGKTVDCKQKLWIKTSKDISINLLMFYFVDKQSREGRIKKRNATLRQIMFKYGLNDNVFDEI